MCIPERDARNRNSEYWENLPSIRAYDHPVVRFFALQRISYICRWLNLDTIKNALDVGCGNGISTYYMHKHIPDITCIDISHYLLSLHPLADTKKTCVVADASRLPFPDNSFDFVYGWEVLHHLLEPQKVVSEMARVSRRYVLISETNPANPVQFAYSFIDKEHRRVREHTLTFLKGLFAAAKLEVAYSGSGGWIFPHRTPLWLFRILRRFPYSFMLGISNWVLGKKDSI